MAVLRHQRVEFDDGWGRPHGDEDDDVDMIPLIDISLVLLIYFMMTSAISALSMAMAAIRMTM